MVNGDDDAVRGDSGPGSGLETVAGDPRPLPHAAFQGAGLLLVEGVPDALSNGFADIGKFCGVVLVGPEGVTKVAMEGVVGAVSEGGKVDLEPSVGFVLE